MMRARPAARNQFVADPRRKRQVGQPVAVEMSNLAVVDSELDSAEAVGLRDDAGQLSISCVIASAVFPMGLPQKSLVCGGAARLLVRSGISGSASTTSSAASSKTVAYA